MTSEPGRDGVNPRPARMRGPLGPVTRARGRLLPPGSRRPGTGNRIPGLSSAPAPADGPRVVAGLRSHRLHRVRRLARRGLGVGRRLARRWVLRFYTRWRRSIQVRVVTSTLLISTVVVAILGVFLMEQITTALLDGKEKSALLQLDEGMAVLERELSPANVPENTLYDVTNQLKARSGPSGLYEVYVRDTGEEYLDGYTTNEVLPESVPERLRRQVRQDPVGTRHSTYSEIHYIGRESVPGLVVGAGNGRYELYYLFPLTQEQQTLTNVGNTLLGVSVFLLVLLAAIASVVTRQVVIPVRLAAQAAERLATGRLEERMKVRGEDDLARLAASFNDMAGNLQEKIVELEELSQVQRQFVSDVSHELRTPLTTIRIAADMIYEHREHFSDPAVGRSAELLQSQLERFEALLADLLEISRHDAGAATLDAESVDVRDLVLRAVGDAEGLAERKGSKLVLQLPGEPCMAEVDRRRVERILRNLLVNAVEHGEGKDIVVSVGADRDAVAIAVRDYGVGLKPGQAQLVFDRFWRADPARARTTGGTGLGLAIAREDAQLHGGWLQAWGEPGKGSQFRLSLPRVAGAELRGSPLPLVPPEIDLPRTSFPGPASMDAAEPSSTPASGAAARASATSAEPAPATSQPVPRPRPASPDAPAMAQTPARGAVAGPAPRTADTGTAEDGAGSRSTPGEGAAETAGTRAAGSDDGAESSLPGAETAVATAGTAGSEDGAGTAAAQAVTSESDAEAAAPKMSPRAAGGVAGAEPATHEDDAPAVADGVGGPGAAGAGTDGGQARSVTGAEGDR